MADEFMRRGYLLPQGCKDLIDVLKPGLPLAPMQPSLPPIIGELFIPGKISARELATLLGQRPFHIMTDLMQLGIFHFVEDLLDFDIVSKVARKYGLIARLAA